MGAYEEALAWLGGLEVTGGWDLKLERMRAAVAHRGHPEARIPALHVAGTNGKGSVAAMLEAVLRAAGYRTGLYTSPHLVDFVERVRAGGRTIPRATVAELVGELRASLDTSGLRLTHFEFVTLLALEWFARIGVDVAVIEVGLGGRLDATNVVVPVVTAITSIALDHQEFLGDDLVAIAGEKAGILKAGVPVAVGRLPPEADAVVTARAAAVGAPVARVGVEGVLDDRRDGLAFRGPHGADWDGLRLGLAGVFQRDNAAVALTALALASTRFPCDVDAVRTGFAAVRWPGRLAVLRRTPLVVADGAHNPAGVAALARELPALLRGRRATLVFAVMADKAWRAMLTPLLPLVERVIATRVGRRGLAPEAIVEELAGRCPGEAVDDPAIAVRTAAAGDTAVVVTGSLFLVGEAYVALGWTGDLFEPWHPSGWSGRQARA